MDSATPPCGCAQNDGMVGDVQGSFRNEGRVRSCSCGADSSELPLPVCAPHKDRGEGLCFRTFPTTFRARFLELPMEATSIHKITIRLLTPENLFPSPHICHSARRAFMPVVAESNTDANGFSSSILRPINLSHAELLGRNHLQPPSIPSFSIITSNIW